MDIDLATLTIAEDEVPILSVGPGNVPVAASSEQGSQLRYIPMLYRDVQIAVSPGLRPEERVHSPTTIHADCNPVAFKEVSDFQNVR